MFEEAPSIIYEIIANCIVGWCMNSSAESICCMLASALSKLNGTMYHRLVIDSLIVYRCINHGGVSWTDIFPILELVVNTWCIIYAVGMMINTISDRLTAAVCRVAGDVQWSRERCLLHLQCCFYRFACLLPNLSMLRHLPNLIILLILPKLAIFAILLFLAHLVCVIVA